MKKLTISDSTVIFILSGIFFTFAIVSQVLNIH